MPFFNSFNATALVGDVRGVPVRVLSSGTRP